MNNELATRPGAEAARFDADEHAWKMLMRRAEVLAKSNLVQRPLQGKPEDVAVVLLACQDLGLPLNVTNVNQFHVIEGSPQPSAQLTLGMAHAAGYDSRWVQSSDTVAELAIRRPGSEFWERFSFSIDDAKRAHMLDEWVEEWTKTENGKNFLKRYVINCQAPTPCKDARGPIPQWAQKQVDFGNVKHKDNYWNYPAAMLMARAASRAIRAAAPEVRLGLVEQIHFDPTVARAVVDAPTVEGDDEITDLEVIVDGEQPVEADPLEQIDDTPVEASAAATPDEVPPVVPPDDGSPVETAAADLFSETYADSKIGVSAAKQELLDAAETAGLPDSEARMLATTVWADYCKNVKGDIPRRTLDIMVADIKARVLAA